VENGQEAVDAFRQSREGEFDLILMDVLMPVMDGYTATRQIRAMDRADAKTVPIMAMTANAYADDARKSKEAGMNAHLSKPVDTAKLFAAIRQVTQGA
jgi:CheY-like chemotaxis protein